MKSYTRGLAWTLVTLGMLGVTGCGPDNETEGQKAAKAEKDPGPINPDSKGSMPPQAKTQEEHFKQQQQSSSMPSGAGGYTQKKQ